MGALNPGQLDSYYPLFVLVLALVAVVAFVGLVIVARFFQLWLQAYICGVGVSLLDLLGMRLRKVDPRPVVFAKIRLVKGGFPHITVEDLEAHVLAGGHVEDVAAGLVAAKNAGKHLDWKQACANDLAGQDILKGATKIASGPAIQQLIGCDGVSATYVWAVGSCEFSGARVPCFSEQGMIEPGVAVEAVCVDGSSLIVRQKEH